MRRAADLADDTAAEQQLTREELCRNRVLTARLEAAERNVRLTEALVAGRPQHWVRHQPQHDRLVPLCVGDVLHPDDGRPWDREEAATVTAVTDLEVHVHWSSDGSTGTLLQECIRVPVVRAPNASQAPTATSAGKYRTPDELRKLEQHLATPHVGFLTTCDAVSPTHPRAPSHPVQQPLICVCGACRRSLIWAVSQPRLLVQNQRSFKATSAVSLKTLPQPLGMRPSTSRPRSRNT